MDKYATYKLAYSYKMTILVTILVILTNISIANSQNSPDTIANEKLQEAIKVINETLAIYPAQYGNSYAEVSRVSVNSKGKLVLYKQHKGESNCTASREEAFLTDLEPTNITSFTKANTMVISIGCKNGIGDCVQRFFRNSCDVTFKSESYQKELLIISGSNLRNTEKIRIALTELISYARDESKTSITTNENAINNSTQALTVETINPPLVLLPANIENKQTKVSLTMDDVEPAERVEERKRRKKRNSNAKRPANAGQATQIEENSNNEVDFDKLIESILKDETKED
ncbi:MAG: hypothetical protein J0M03_22290 [Acidobacteria bacterium]|nr:hypothetical protein [Acidobacteriota bacterium]